MRIFVSYSRADASSARTLAEDLGSLGHSPWLDRALSGGQPWWDRILDEVRGCDAFAFLLSPDALKSTACKSEYGYAADLGKPILPLLVADGVSTRLLPPELSKIQFVDYRENDREAALRLARALSSLPTTPPLPDPLPPGPEAPLSPLARIAERIAAPEPMSYEAQSALLIDLRRVLSGPATASDASTLLDRFRKRHDLYAAVADEIDALLTFSKTKDEALQRSATLEAPARKSGHRAPASTRDAETTGQQRLRAAGQLGFAGLGASLIVATVLAAVFGFAALHIAAMVAPLMLGGAAGGTIAGSQRRAQAGTLIGIALGIVWAIAAPLMGLGLVTTLLSFALPVAGAVIGAKGPSETQ